jgi:hypothetical protein
MSNTACPCDNPAQSVLQIPAGLSALPRQTQTFPDVRRALLATVPTRPALDAWRARGPRDFGLMWLEMWAYVADVLGFYDERIANETYIRTAVRKPALRRIVGMLGYVPAPGVAGTAVVAAISEGNVSVTVPKGSALRSTSFVSAPPESTNQPPQVFEVTVDTPIHPLLNSWQLGPVAAVKTTANTAVSLQAATNVPTSTGTTTSTTTVTEFVFDTAGFGLAKGWQVLIRENSEQAGQVSSVRDIKPFEGKDGKTYLRVTLNSEITLTQGLVLSDIQVLTPTITASPIDRKTDATPIEKPPADGRTPIIQTQIDSTNNIWATQADLSTVYRQLRVKDSVIISGPPSAAQSSSAATPGEVQAPNGLSSHLAIDVRDVPVPVPGAAVPSGSDTPTFPITSMQLSPPRAGDSDDEGFDFSQYTFNFRCVPAGRVTEVSETQPTSDNLRNGAAVIGVVQAPPGLLGGTLTQKFLLRDAADQGALVDGILTFNTDGTASFQVTGGDLPATLTTPITVFGNLLYTTRGESAFNEVLGDGNAQIPLQSFKLKKKPLTYLADQPVDDVTPAKSTLQIRVNQVLWQEVPSFFGHGPQEQIYILRTDDEQNTIVTFGDGVSGARLPSGVRNVVATYRFGSGAAAPPAGAIRQLAGSVKGLRKVESPIAATGGRDPDAPDAIRTAAPKSLLLFGHLVSAPDFEVRASQILGVVKAVAEFLFISPTKGAGMVITYIGNGTDLNAEIVSTLQLLAEPGLFIEAREAKALSAFLFFEVEVDKRFDKDIVAQAVKDALAAGPLAKSNAPIGQPLYRSVLFDVVQGVPGVCSAEGDACYAASN